MFQLIKTLMKVMDDMAIISVIMGTQGMRKYYELNDIYPQYLGASDIVIQFIHYCGKVIYFTKNTGQFYYIELTDCMYGFSNCGLTYEVTKYCLCHIASD